MILYKPGYIYKISLDHSKKIFTHVIFGIVYENSFVTELGHNRVIQLRSTKFGKYIKKITGYEFLQS